MTPRICCEKLMVNLVVQLNNTQHELRYTKEKVRAVNVVTSSLRLSVPHALTVRHCAEISLSFITKLGPFY